MTCTLTVFGFVASRLFSWSSLASSAAVACIRMSLTGQSLTSHNWSTKKGPEALTFSETWSLDSLSSISCSWSQFVSSELRERVITDISFDSCRVMSASSSALCMLSVSSGESSSPSSSCRFLKRAGAVVVGDLVLSHSSGSCNPSISSRSSLRASAIASLGVYSFSHKLLLDGKLPGDISAWA